MCFSEITARFPKDYREGTDGVIAAYLQDDRTWAVLNDPALVPPRELSFPGWHALPHG